MRHVSIPEFVDGPLQIVYFFTTFPKASEAFLQREVDWLRTQAVELRLISIHKGAPVYSNMPVTRFSKWRLLSLVFWVPYWIVKKPNAFFRTLRDLFRHPCPEFLNFQETLLGLGYALVMGRRLSREYSCWHLHATWATAPASALLALHRFTGRPFSMEAHAYDIFTGGGDWLIRLKLEACQFVRTSTNAGRSRLIELGCDPQKIHRVRRGLVSIPPLPSHTQEQEPIPLQLLSVGRFVPKKGLFTLLKIMDALKSRGHDFTLRLVGDGPLRDALATGIKEYGLDACITLPGFLTTDELASEYRQARFLLFTGEVAPDGNRDGLPNVLPEAMAAGAVVLTTAVGATAEAVEHGQTGLILPRDQPEQWADSLLALHQSPQRYLDIRKNAHRWVEKNYDLRDNLKPMITAFRNASHEGRP